MDTMTSLPPIQTLNQLATTISKNPSMLRQHTLVFQGNEIKYMDLIRSIIKQYSHSELGHQLSDSHHILNIFCQVLKHKQQILRKIHIPVEFSKNIYKFLNLKIQQLRKHRQSKTMLDLSYYLYINLLLIVKVKLDHRFKASSLHMVFKPHHMRKLATININQMPYWGVRVLLMVIYYILGQNNSTTMQKIAKSLILQMFPYANDTFSHSYLLKIIKKIHKVLTLDDIIQYKICQFCLGCLQQLCHPAISSKSLDTIAILINRKPQIIQTFVDNHLQSYLFPYISNKLHSCLSILSKIVDFLPINTFEASMFQHLNYFSQKQYSHSHLRTLIIILKKCPIQVIIGFLGEQNSKRNLLSLITYNLDKIGINQLYVIEEYIDGIGDRLSEVNSEFRFVFMSSCNLIREEVYKKWGKMALFRQKTHPFFNLQ